MLQPVSEKDSLIQVLTKPSPASLWQLRAELLELGLNGENRILPILDQFYHFLNELVARSSAREYSHLASILDMTAVAGVAIQNLMSEQKSEDWWQRFLVGAASEGLMILAARQYVKGWEQEMNANYNAAAWYLSQEYWNLSLHLQPELPPTTRRQLVDHLMSPILNRDVDGVVRAGLTVRFFQVLLLISIVTSHIEY